MADLFRIGTGGGILQVSEQPFVDEVGDLEDFITKNPRLLGEGGEILGRQVSVGAAGRIDLLIIDKSLGAGQIAVVELKKEPADVRVLLQVLRYASWVVSNPDSIRLLLERSKIKADEVELKPRIVVVAPSILDELVELTQYVGSFEFDLIEIRRFEQGDEKFVVVTRKSPVGPPPPGIGSQEDWSWEKYKADLGWKPEQISLGQVLLQEVERIIHTKGWPLRYRFRKGYVPFQLGARNVVGIEPRWAKGFAIWFRLPKPPKDLNIDIPTGLQVHWGSNYYSVNIIDAEFDLDTLVPLFTAAYEAVS